MIEDRFIGEEAHKSQQARLASGFVQAYLSGDHILDIGYKGYLQEVVPVVPQAIGVDLDYPGYDGRTLPFGTGSQDAVFASHCLEHIDDVGQSLRDWFRVLRTGGFLVIMVPHQFLYEKRVAPPSRFNADHKRFYTPGALMSEIEAVLAPNTYRLRHLADNDRGFDYALPPETHSGGCYEIELVIEKIATPAWVLDIAAAEAAAGLPDLAGQAQGLDAPPVARRAKGVPSVHVLQAKPWDVSLYDLGHRRKKRRRILALQLGHLGDFIIGLPALRQLRAAFPNDFIRLVVGTWNRHVAEQSGLVDDVVTHNFFPEVARNWNGKPAQPPELFRAAVEDHYDIALDLRVDEDTRHLLDYADAGLRCGIGEPARFPNLDIILPYDIGSRRNKGLDGVTTQYLSPDEFHSRMPVRTPFRHQTNFAISNQHLIYGPYMRLPAGRFRVTFGLQTSGPRIALRRVRLKLDVCLGGETILAEREFTADRISSAASDECRLEFTNREEQGGCEFRVLAMRRPLLASLAFFGVRLDQLDAPVTTRLKPANLHIGEQLSMLVQLVADRTSRLYPDADNLPATLPAVTQNGPPGRHRVVIAPLSNSDLRDWPQEHYAALIKSLVERLDCTVFLTGSPSQQSALAHIVQAAGASPRVVNLAGQAAWSEMPGILRTADLVICNNSGVAHLAASLNVRTLAIYSASHQPGEWGPRGAQARALMANVPCSPCGFDRLSNCTHHHACMRGLLPETVFAQAASWLAGD